MRRIADNQIGWEVQTYCPFGWINVFYRDDKTLMIVATKARALSLMAARACAGVELRVYPALRLAA